MRIAVTGASGFIGSALVPALQADGHDVVRLVRREPRSSDEARWDPPRLEVDPAAIDGSDAVVHLAGASIGGRRWNDEYRQLLRDSRIEGTTAIAQAITKAEQPPRVLVCAGGVDYYGDTGDAVVDESGPPGSGFLPELSRDWEEASRPAADAGTRVVHTRMGLVLGRRGGALGPLLPLFRFGLGGRLGSGRQWVSWVALPDVLAAYRFLLSADGVSGPVNITSPQPVTNADYTRAIARAVRRPAPWVVPPFALRVALDGLADVVLASHRVVPARLEAEGFRFSSASLRDTLATIV